MGIIGSFDGIKNNKLWGWAVDIDNQQLPLAICIYKNNVLALCTMASKERLDILNHPDVIDTSHGFNEPFICSDGDVISAYAVLLKKQSMQELSNSPIIMQNKLPIGSLDGVTETYARGWAFDSNVGLNSIDVHVYDGDKLIAMAKADQSRGDLTPVIGDPNHGFKVNFPELSLGTHEIHAYAINIP